MPQPEPCAPRLSLLGKMWTLKSPTIQDIQTYQRLTSLDVWTTTLLINRGVLAQDAGAFLNPTLKDTLPNPMDFKDMNRAVDRFFQAIMNHEKIGIFGDYDVDGATSSALLERFLGHIGHTCRVYIPDRVTEGYGPNSKALTQLHGEGCTLVVTVDSGGTAFAPLAHAQNIGLDIIVLDHHQGDGDPPPAVAVVNPNRPDDPCPHTHLAAVGVTFLFLVALSRRLEDHGFFTPHRPKPSLLDMLDLVALGTVCDVMPLKTINRTFVYQGCKVLRQTKNIGLRALMDVAGINPAEADSYHLGFMIGPRINAGGRLGASALGAQLLATTCNQTAASLAAQLHQFNLDRQEIEKACVTDALNQLQATQSQPAHCLSSDTWPQGVIGLIASCIKDKSNRPCFVITFDENGVGKGSGRSHPAFDMGAFLHRAKQKDLIVAGGGHPMAGGLTLHRGQLDAFEAYLLDQTQHLIFENALILEGVLPFNALTPSLIANIEALAPFGPGNPRPKFWLKDLRVAYARIVGDNHIQCSLEDAYKARVQAVAFRALDTPLGNALMGPPSSRFDIAATLKLNTYAGRSSVQIIIEDAVDAS